MKTSYHYYFLSPANHKGMDNEKINLGRSTERYLNINGRWSGLSPRKTNNKLLAWEHKDEALNAIALANSFGRKMNLCSVDFTNKKLLEKIVIYNSDYILCLKGYI